MRGGSFIFFHFKIKVKLLKIYQTPSFSGYASKNSLCKCIRENVLQSNKDISNKNTISI